MRHTACDRLYDAQCCVWLWLVVCAVGAGTTSELTSISTLVSLSCLTFQALGSMLLHGGGGKGALCAPSFSVTDEHFSPA